MKIKKGIITTMIVLIIIVITCTPVLAASYKVVYLHAGQVWTQGYGEAHDTNYSYVGAMCHSVYPYSGPDYFTKIQCKVTNTYDNVITTSSHYVLSENASNYTSMKIAEGYLATSTVYFHFRGNSQEQAQAIVSYIGTYVV